MNQNILAKIRNINEDLSLSDEKKELDKVNSLLNSSDEVALQAMKVEQISNEYSFLATHNMDKDKIASAQKALYLEKKKLDEMPLVKQYMKSYLSYKEYADYINKEIFGLLN